jgi:hypothetical protein
MQDWRDGQVRYLVHFSDGGSGMRLRDEPLAERDELTDGGTSYRVERVEQPPNPRASGTPWGQDGSATPRDSTPKPGTPGVAPSRTSCSVHCGGRDHKDRAGDLAAQRAERDWSAAIRSAHAEGCSITAIARAVGVPEAEVRRIVKQQAS